MNTTKGAGTSPPWRPHLIFSTCKPGSLSSARAFSLVAKSPTCRNGETAGVLRESSLCMKKSVWKMAANAYRAGMS